MSEGRGRAPVLTWAERPSDIAPACSVVQETLHVSQMFYSLDWHGCPPPTRHRLGRATPMVHDYAPTRELGGTRSTLSRLSRYVWQPTCRPRGRSETGVFPGVRRHLEDDGVPRFLLAPLLHPRLPALLFQTHPVLLVEAFILNGAGTRVQRHLGSRLSGGRCFRRRSERGDYW